MREVEVKGFGVNLKEEIESRVLEYSFEVKDEEELGIDRVRRKV